MAETITIILLPALIIGCILALIEMIFVHSDEIGMGWFMRVFRANVKKLMAQDFKVRRDVA